MQHRVHKRCGSALCPCSAVDLSTGVSAALCFLSPYCKAKQTHKYTLPDWV